MIRVLKVLVVVTMVLSMASVPVAAAAGDLATETAEPACEYPLSITDATDTEVTIEEPPDEIVVMHASGAQIAQDIGAWDRVTGAPVTAFTAYLDDHDQPVDVTDDEGFPIVEVIVDLDPDVVIAGHVGDSEKVEVLRDHGLTVYMGPTPTDVDDIRSKVLTYGTLIDACDEAVERVDWMDERLGAVDDLVEDRDERPLAYYELGDGWTAGEGTFQHDLIERAGADNLGAEAEIAGWGIVDEEVVVDLNPDFIVYGDATEEPLVSEAIRETPAMQENRTVSVDSNLVNQAGPRVVLVLETMAEAFAAGPIDEADEEPVADDADEPHDEDAEETEPGDEDDREVTTLADDDDTAEALPGFGAIAATVALLAGALARVRR